MAQRLFLRDCSEDFFIELIQLENKNPKEHENITDLSYLHVKYINRRVKKKNILDEIKIAKAFVTQIDVMGQNHIYMVFLDILGITRLLLQGI